MPFYLIPIIVIISVQVLKLIIESWKHKFTWNHLLSNGGMPSSHSALATSATTIIGFEYGVDSPLFVLALVFTMIVVWDAFTIRYQMGNHGQIINKLVKELPDNKEYKYPLLIERWGHKISEIAVGIVLGILFTYFLYMI
jgi:uncharacterized protein